MCLSLRTCVHECNNNTNHGGGGDDDDDDDDNNDNNNNNRIERRKSTFFTISSLRRNLSPTRTLKWPGRNCVQISCNTSDAHHVQHVVYATCHKV